MDQGLREKTLLWTPRILAIAFAAFISIFAMDAENFIGLLIHLIPTYLVVAALIVAWRWPTVGGILFLLLGILYILLAFKQAPALAYLIIDGPLFLIGVLFIARKYFTKSARASTSSNQNPFA